MNKEIKIEILDCTFRDGGYINNWRFDKKLVREAYRSLSKSGVDFVELGFRSSEKYFDTTSYGPWRYSREENLREVIQGIEGAKIAVMGDYGKMDWEDLEDKSGSVVDLVRLAAHKDQIFNAMKFLEKIKSKGYLTSLQVMAYASYTDREKEELKRAVAASAMDYFYIADSYGSILPEEIEGMLGPFIEMENIKVGFHPHNNLQLAFANTLAAMRVGADIIDSSLYGMGRGAGNLPTEVLIAYLGVRGNGKYNVIPVLNCIDTFFEDLKKENPWGYQLPYMISGIFNCHPNYAKDLVKRREYSIEDIWKALEVVREMKPIGFKRSIIQGFIERGVVGSLGKSVGRETGAGESKAPPVETAPVPYLGRHPGQDFLVLANGPTLKEYQPQIQAFIDQYQPVVLGANYLSDLFQPHYHAFNNKKRFAMHIDTVSPRSKLLIGENIPASMIAEYVQREYETLYFRDVLNADFDIRGGRIQCNCRTISVLLLGVAIVMGAKRIFAVGMDGYLGKKNLQGTLFYDEKHEPDDLDVNIERHRWSERFLQQIDRYIQDQGREGLHILTPTSYYAFYKGIENYL
ncbi:MAG: aldolase catalytic domain-containing protein [Syntrophobacterales bacterium]|jgi:4-hydroxy 2-oxovalerate aldolase|nr:aldolase catalytic domain-containing protein [Syntrophobacterales bacterium]